MQQTGRVVVEVFIWALVTTRPIWHCELNWSLLNTIQRFFALVAEYNFLLVIQVFLTPYICLNCESDKKRTTNRFRPIQQNKGGMWPYYYFFNRAMYFCLYRKIANDLDCEAHQIAKSSCRCQITQAWQAHTQIAYEATADVNEVTAASWQVSWPFMSIVVVQNCWNFSYWRRLSSLLCHVFVLFGRH